MFSQNGPTKGLTVFSLNGSLFWNVGVSVDDPSGCPLWKSSFREFGLLELLEFFQKLQVSFFLVSHDIVASLEFALACLKSV